METLTIDAAGILRDLEQAKAERIRLADLSRRIGWNRAQQSLAISAGVLEAKQSRPGPGNPYTVTRDEAFTLLLAAVLAVAAGIATGSALRGLKGTGVTGPLAAEVLRATVPT